MSDTITLPRSTVEQALKAFKAWDARGRLRVMAALSAALEQPQVEQEPIRWPANASEVRAFLSGHVAAERYARDDHQPDDNDTYTLSAHDLLGAIDWWTDFDPQPPRQPLTDEEINSIWRNSTHMTVVEVVRAIEAAHGIGGEA